VLVREIAARHGRLATFLGRPFNDRGGSGMHVNLSFRRRDGSNAFHDPDDPDGLSDLARRSIAGFLAHHRGMAAICAPTVNAYKRLKPDMLNGYPANWGFDDRTVGVRVPPARGEGSRVEHRMADAAANPYLVGAALLHAARMGVVEELELGPAQEPGADLNTDVAVPNTLEEALGELRSDAKLVGALGEWLVESFVSLKQAEWERYVAAGETSDTDVTPWELEYYLPYF
jgi:glutamine synthetase